MLLWSLVPFSFEGLDAGLKVVGKDRLPDRVKQPAQAGGFSGCRPRASDSAGSAVKFGHLVTDGAHGVEPPHPHLPGGVPAGSRVVAAFSDLSVCI